MVKTCTNCRYDREGIPNMYCHGCYNHSKHKLIPQTNDDRINTMSAEEKADFFAKFTTICEMCIHINENCMTMSDERCREGILQWLKSEAKE